MRKPECFDPTTVRVGQLGEGRIAIDGRLFPLEMTLADVGWSPRAAVCALPPINASEFIHPRPRGPPKWTVKNVYQPDEPVEVTGPTVGKAVEQILGRRTRPQKGEVVLRITGGAPLRDLAAQLPREAALEFIDSLDAKMHASKEFPGIAQKEPDLEEWLALIKGKDWDVYASLAEVKARPD
jgi:hypothetical protein